MQPLYFVMVFLKKAHTVNLEKELRRIGVLQIEEQFFWDWEQYDDSQIKLLTFIPPHTHSFWAGAHCEFRK